MKKSNILQINNQYIQKELQKSQAYLQEKKQKNRFMGSILILVIFLFVLPTYNLVNSYQNLQKREQQLSDLQVRYKELEKQQKIESSLVKKLEDEEYVTKYIRAKLQYSKDGEFIYNIPGLLPR
ncbi:MULTISPECIES: septum formation initiator family protein [unclassified Streptococcus]|uniref:FtsB family cell division protein n=1 Tax=unclassified Streptococcus TaxID=2608887 RepID=UPI001072980F|nr:MULTISPECIES: septum formation initiator family protein [unclassified Streptococcus]MBF0786989.1 septum formation initiator family protein [Streptococcus sp. 19428wC2_LYSM12]MCQ9211533.1 septum formation initiator family protein [Streptococcus sp. B01]MCQ9214849.1 septum formation initiator family protein [Streptococcus sp. O1]TFV06187.1 septum formation initiator family protein [Streptococcus sp. LYSM12]